MSDTEIDDEAAIRALDAAWGEAASCKDLEAVVAFYATDGSLVWPGIEAVHGTEAIRATWRDMIDSTPGLALRFVPDRIVVAGDASLASDFGKVEFGHDASPGHPVQEIGKYVVVWRKEQGAWKVLYDSYNMNEAG